MPTIKLTTTVTAQDATIPTIEPIDQPIPVEEVRTPKFRVSHNASGCKTTKRISTGPRDQLKVFILVPKKVEPEATTAGSATSAQTDAAKTEPAKTAAAGYCHKLSFSTSDAEDHGTCELPLDGPRIFTDSALASLFGEGQTEIECVTFYNRTESDYDVTCIIGYDLTCPEPPAACKS